MSAFFSLTVLAKFIAIIAACMLDRFVYRNKGVQENQNEKI
jgi:hypothetical protein